MSYIANKPIRFDRTYAIWEAIPNEVINLKAEKWLIDTDRIIKVNLSELVPPTVTENESGGEQSTPNGEENGTDDNTPPNGEELTQGASQSEQDGEVNGVTDEVAAVVAAADSNDDEPPFKCSVCGKVCKTQTALTAHMKTHDKD